MQSTICYYFLIYFNNIHFIGLQADEIHLCGEAGSIGLVEEICNTTGEEMEVGCKITILDIIFGLNQYSRL